MNRILGDIGQLSATALVPELYLLASTLVILVYGVYRLKLANNFLVLIGLLVFAVTAYLAASVGGTRSVLMNGMFVSDAFTASAKCLMLIAGALTLLISTPWLKEEGGRPFEFVLLMLFSTLGAMLMVSAADLLSVYMGLEMMSLSLYVMAAFDRDHEKSSEAGLKYFVLGALASGMMLFGMSLVYGFAGSTSFAVLTDVFASGGVSQGVTVGMVLIIVGFCFKASAAPFHMWAPDVYEGAPTPVTAFFSTVPKIAAITLFARVMLQPFAGLIEHWQQVIIFASVASMLVGALAAIMQTNIKRLLAYSSIGHAGFMLMGLAAGNESGVQAILIYLAVYVFMSAGTFGCILLMKRDGEPVEEISALAGLSQRRPAMALALSIFMFSMAGIPPLAGFFGKLYVVLAAIEAGLAWLAVIAVATSVIGCYYYIRIVKLMYFDAPAHSFDPQIPLSLKAGVSICALFTLLFFLLPTPLVAQAKIAATALMAAL